MPTPAAIPALAVVSGAALGALLPSVPTVALLVPLLLACALAAAAFARRRNRAFAASVAATFVLASWLLADRATGAAANPPLRDSLAHALGAGPIVLEGRLAEDASAGESGVGISLQVERWTWNGGTTNAPGGVRLTVGGAMGVDAMDRWRAGRKVRVPALLRVPGRYRDPGVPDGRLALARKGIALVGSVKSAALVEVVGRGSAAAEAGAAVRRLTRRAILRHVGPRDAQSAAIVTAILIGDRAGLAAGVQLRLQEAGTYHVIAISGGNIAILAGLILWACRQAGIGHRGSGWLTMTVLVGYAAAVGWGASVARATLMAVIYLAARQADHRSAPLNALAVTATLVLVATPDAVADVAFWLTFGATLGILVGVGLAGPRVPRAPFLRVPAVLLLTSVCAELALFPIAARVFARVTCAGLALNFVAIPMMTVAQVAGMLTVALSRLWPWGADACGLAAHLGAAGLVRSAALVDLVPWLSYRLPPPHALAIAGYYAGWVLLLSARSVGRGASGASRWQPRLRRCGAALACLCGAWILVEPVSLFFPGVSGRLRVTMLDVGHGDAVLVQLPDRRSLLVDAGGSLGGSFDVGGRVVSPALWALGVRRLEVFVLTHGDPDHAGGAASVVRDFRPREIWEGVPVPGLASVRALQDQAAAAGIPWRARRAGDSSRFGAVTIRIRHPPPPDWERRKVRNDDSMVLEIQYGAVSIVLTGDIGRDVERPLTAQFDAVALRAVKIPHHGSATSSSVELVGALRPRVAVLSAGPTTKVSDEVLRRYRDAGAAIYRTDGQGAVTLETDGSALTVTTFTGDGGVFRR